MTALTVVFDLDGTLVDTAPDLIATLNVVFAREGLPPVPYAEARDMIGAGARAMIESGLTRERRAFSPGMVDRMFADFIAYYSDHIADHSQPFPGLDAALDHLDAAGYRLAVCTNKLEGLSRLLLEALGLTRRFTAICGQDTFRIQKPNPEILRRTILAAGGDIRRSVMVGDSGTDIATARAAGIPAVAVDFGYSETPIGQLGADRLISHYDALAAAVLEVVPAVR
ncbi:MAG: phosphoglycolate phosphatase [Alphaproteobacteria bacterium]|nr:phosphoglycolate phosphatase [Alphaproteobacteria bacterium]